MSDRPLGEGWWLASDGKWYPPESRPGAAPAAEPQRPAPSVSPGTAPGEGWWLASDGNWYPPEARPGRPYAHYGAPAGSAGDFFYAGFWRRAVAYIIDVVLMSIVAIAAVALVQEPGFVIVIVAAWLYWAGMESSQMQATLGKKAIGIVVTDLDGRRISFGRATGRLAGRIITHVVPFGIGYIMAGITQRKQALHDLIASTLVLIEEA